MKTLIIGGTGHIGAFLTAMLREDGQRVVVVTSGRHPIPEAQRGVSYVQLEYSQALRDGTLQALLMEARPDAVVDILQGDIAGVYQACRQTNVAQLVACGSLWMFGRPAIVPTPAVTQSPCLFAGYQRRYDAMLATLATATVEGMVAFTGIMPPNICGPGKIPLEGMGGRALEVHRAHQRGDEVTLPEPGTTLIGPCDAEDVARGFFCALKHPEGAGEIYNVGAAYALTARQFIASYAAIYGVDIPIRYVAPSCYVEEISPDLGANYHFLEHMCPDISRITGRLYYRPKYTPEAAMERAVRWMYEQRLLSEQ